MSGDTVAVAAMAGLFVASIAIAIALAPIYSAEDVQAFENPESLANPVFYLGIVIVFTLVILLIARKGLKTLLRLIILASVLATIYIVAWPLLALVLSDLVSAAIAGVLAVGLTALLWFYPEWYVIDATGVIVSAGAGAIFGISFGLLPALLLLVAFAAYDAYAVYKSKHMLDLADNVLELRLPIMFVVPKHRGYSFLEETRKIKEHAEGEKREAMFMGLGDAVIPCVLVVSAATFLADQPAAVAAVGGVAAPLVVALATLAGGILGFGALMYFVMKGNPQAGLPLLNGGAILGFLAALVPLYGLAPLWPF